MADTVVNNSPITKIYIVDVSALTLGSSHTFDAAHRIKPPVGVKQRRLTRLADTEWRITKKPRHWLIASPDGTMLAVLLERNHHPPQLFTLDVTTLKLTQRTFLPGGVTTAISWSRDGHLIAFGSENSIFVLDTQSWKIRTVATSPDGTLLPLCCCISPNASRIAVQIRQAETNHIGIATIR
jgi:hypothetical protein